MERDCSSTTPSCRILMLVTQIAALLMLPDATGEEYFSTRHSCTLRGGGSPMNYSRDGDIIVGGILQVFLKTDGEEPNFLDVPTAPVCTMPTFQYLRHLLAFIYAIEEINNSTEILPNITLGFQIYDACNSEVIALKSTLNIISETQDSTPNYICQRHRMVAFIGHLLSSTTYSKAGITQLYGYPQISYGALDHMFNDHVHFPSVYRTVPNEYSQVKVIIQLLIHFGWTWVGIIALDDASNLQASEELIKEFRRMGICESYLSVISKNSALSLFRTIEIVKYSSANVIILFCSPVYFLRLLHYGTFEATSGKVWISSVTMNIITDYGLQNAPFLHAFNGSLLISFHKGEIPGFKNFLSQATFQNMPDNIFVEYFWGFTLGCLHNKHKLSNSGFVCSGEALWRERLSGEESNTYHIPHTIYIAVYLLAKALHEMYLAKALLEPSSEGFAAKTRYQLNHYLKNVHLRTVSGEEIFFDEKGYAPKNFDILNWVIYSNATIQNIHIGSFSSTSQQLLIDERAIKWNPYFKQTPRSRCSEICPFGHHKTQQIAMPPCCFDCVPCSDGEIANSTDMENCLKCPQDHWSDRGRDQCIKRTIDFLSYEDFLGAVLAAVAVIFLVFTSAVLWVFLKHRSTPIVRANNRDLSYILLVSLMLSFLCSFMFIGRPVEVTCLLRQATFGFIFAVAISSILGKTVTVVIAFNATKPGSKLRKWVGSKTSISLVPLCSLGELVICITWLIYAPPFVDLDTKTTNEKIILQCNEGSLIAFYLAVSYTGILSLFSFLIAFMARTLPDGFNEAQSITFSMLVFCSVWVSFIPAYLSTKGKYMVAVEIFAILASTAGLLGCIFIPKCYIILLKPELNTRGQLIVKTKYIKK